MTKHHNTAVVPHGDGTWTLHIATRGGGEEAARLMIRRRDQDVEIQGTDSDGVKLDLFFDVGVDDSGLETVSPETHDSIDAINFRRIVAAKAAIEGAEVELRDAVAAAREAGDSWTVIGAAIGTTRQGAYQRFGR